MPHFPGVHKVLMTVDPEADHRIRKLSIFAGDDQIKRPHQHQATSNGFALNRSNGGFRHVAPAPAEAEEYFLFHGHVTFLTRPFKSPNAHFGRAEIPGTTPAAFAFDVVPGREMRSVGADDDCAHVVIEHGGIQRRIDLIEHMSILRVTALFPRQHDSRHRRARPFVADRLEFP